MSTPPAARKSPSENHITTGRKSSSDPLAAAERRRLLEEQEAIIRAHKGDEYAVCKAFIVIDTARAYKACVPPYRRIQDYVLREHGKDYRQWRKLIGWVRVNEVLRQAATEKCPDGHISAPLPLLNKAKARELEPLLKKPDLLLAAYNEAAAAHGSSNGPLPTYLLNEAATKQKKVMAQDAVVALTAQDAGDRFQEWFVCGDMVNDQRVNDNWFDMVITSPPYGLVEIEYDVYRDNVPHAEYLVRLEQWARRVKSALKQGGRACINLPNTFSRNRDSNYIQPLPSRLFAVMEMIGGMHLYQWLTWDRVYLTDAQAANWGSYNSCSLPNARRRTESILIFAKGTNYRHSSPELRDISEPEFVAWSQDLWSIAPDRSVTWHPCPFPLEIPVRLMLLYGQRKDRILDCFGGSGTTAVAAALLDRECLSVDLSPTYTDLGRRRLIEYVDSGKGKNKLDIIRRRADQNSTNKYLNVKERTCANADNVVEGS